MEDRELFLRIRNLHPFFLPELPTSPTLTKNLKIDIKVAFENVYSVNGNNSHKATLQDIATLLNISPRSLQRKLTSELGVTFTQSRLSFRLERSKELLQQGYNSSDVATILAFASPSHFSSCFKKYFDVTPSAFLNSNELNQ